VCDSGGRLVAFQRMDNTNWASVYGSQGKAVASASFGMASGDLTPLAEHPTFRDGVVDGACGVGSGTGEEDEICARAGVEQL